MADTSYFQPMTRAVFNTATLGASYAALNGSGFPRDAKMVMIINLGTHGIDVSYDGVNDQDYYSSGEIRKIDLQQNHDCNAQTGGGTWHMRSGQIIYGKGTAGTGNLYIIGYQ